MIRETYLAKLKKAREEYPEAEFIPITRVAHHILSPSWELINDYDNGKGISWAEYTRRYLAEIDTDKCRQEIQRISELAKTKDVYLVCYEKPPKNCHRFIVLDMVKKCMEDGRTDNLF